MAFAISLKAANSTADPIRALWAEVARFESRPSMAALGYPPHITLAVYDAVDPERLRAVLRDAFMGACALRLTFTRLRVFDDDPLVLWAEPSYLGALSGMHARVHDRIDPRLCRPHYRPDAWVPHCTLGTQIVAERRAEAAAFAARPIQAFEVVFDVADCVSFPPVAVIEERPLSGPE
jgi:2'-5' RNA ligase